jgi:hypothetical protein
MHFIDLEGRMSLLEDPKLWCISWFKKKQIEFFHYVSYRLILTLNYHLCLVFQAVNGIKEVRNYTKIKYMDVLH